MIKKIWKSKKIVLKYLETLSIFTNVTPAGNPRWKKVPSRNCLFILYLLFFYYAKIRPYKNRIFTRDIIPCLTIWRSNFEHQLPFLTVIYTNISIKRLNNHLFYLFGKLARNDRNEVLRSSNSWFHPVVARRIFKYFRWSTGNTL